MVHTKQPERGLRETIIEPRFFRGFQSWKELWEYRDLFRFFVLRDLEVRYRQTFLGPIWLVLQPLLSSFLFSVIFHGALKIPTEGIPPFLFYLGGVMLWNYFAVCLISTSSCLTANADLFRKVYFPRFLLPFSAVCSHAVSLLIQAAIFAAVYFYFKTAGAALPEVHLGFCIVMFPLWMLQIALLALGVGFWVASLSIRYRDLQLAMGPLIQIWMYASPVIYGWSSLPTKWKLWLAWNPMAGLLESFRQVVFGTQGMPSWMILAAWAGILFLFSTGVLVFRKAQRTFVDIV